MRCASWHHAGEHSLWHRRWVPPSAVLTCACALQAIPGISYDRSSGYWKVVGGCANVASLPPVTFTIGGVGLDLQPQQWTRSVRS